MLKSAAMLNRRAKNLLLVAAFATLAAAAAAPAQAAHYTVTSSADSAFDTNCLPGSCTLRQAVMKANTTLTADTITVPPGNYGYTPINGPLQITAGTLTIDGAGPSATTINGAGTSFTLIQIAAAAQTTIRGLTITAGNAFQGGGVVYGSSASSVFDNVVFTGNVARPSGGTSGSGGALYKSGTGTLTLLNSQITGNTAAADPGDGTGGIGGGVVASDGNLIFVNSALLDNRATSVGNATGGIGGGLSANGANVTFSDSRITGNVVEGGTTTGGIGAGVVIGTNSLNLYGSTVSNNSALAGTANVIGGIGAGINSNGAVVNAVNATIADNLAEGKPLAGGHGGGLQSNGGYLSFTSSTISGNSASAAGSVGGNINANGGEAEYVNSIVAGGSAGTGANCAGAPTVTSSGRNLESTDTCGMGPADLKNTDPKLGPLADNGGPTKTIALSVGSPAIDAALDCPPPATDQRGTARPQGAACDIGAYELVPLTPADTTAPVVSGVSLKPSSFYPAKGRGASISAKKKKKRKTGTKIEYSLSEAATVTFTVEQQVKGRKKGKTCRAKRRKGKRCTIYKTVKGSFSQAGKSGKNTLKFTGRVNGRPLRRGGYRLVVTPKDAAGNAGATQRKAFKVKKG